MDSAMKKYLSELSDTYPTRRAAAAEIVRLGAVLNLPKGTEHFLSDLHGEHEAFSHIRRNASGVIRKKIDLLFSDRMSDGERAVLATLIYYPEERLEGLTLGEGEYVALTERLTELLCLVSDKYTRQKVRDRIGRSAGEYAPVIEELIYDSGTKGGYQHCENIPRSVARLGIAEEFTIALCRSVRALVIDRLHIVGDIFDRGPRADMILDELLCEDSIDMQWGNHDALWMGAAAGSRTCIATVISNSITYGNLDVLEIGYGISLRPLALFASEVYRDSDVSAFMPRGDERGGLHNGDDLLMARMHKAISIIGFKLEGAVIRRNPSFGMEDRMLLHRIDRKRRTVTIDSVEYHLRDCDLPTVDTDDPYRLTDGEEAVMRYLKLAFLRSEKLGRHIRFLFERGGMYTVFNRNLLFHGCIPLNSEGEFMPLAAAGGKRGRELMDYCDRMARLGYFAKEDSAERRRGKDFLWFLWCGRDSPLCARKKIATLERLFVVEEAARVEPKNDYYRAWEDEGTAEMILAEFGLGGEGSHIINGHIPIKRGETPIKAGGRLIVIDGGFCRAYHSRTGIAGYTLIYSSEGIRLTAHAAFAGRDAAIRRGADIISDTVVFEAAHDRIRVRETDLGYEIRDRITDLMLLIRAYEGGDVKERVK